MISGSASRAATTAGTFAGSGTITSVGALEPAGKEAATSSWPRTDSVSERKSSCWVIPLSKAKMPSESTSRPTSVPIQIGRGLRPMRSPMRR